jgi:putative hydrolase of the HAD superfamily
MINWGEIDTVLLDMDGTLLDLHFDNHFWLTHLPTHYAERHSMSFEEAQQQLLGRIMAKRGTIEWYCLDYWADELEVDIMGLKDQIVDRIAIRPSVLNFLNALKNSNKSIWLVTNSHRKGLDLKLAHTSIGEYFERLVVSHDYKVAKENQRFWQAMQAEHPFVPEKSVFIDDSEAVLDAAKLYGIGHLLTISQPDSKMQSRENLRYTAVNSFDDLLPIG